MRRVYHNLGLSNALQGLQQICNGLAVPSEAIHMSIAAQALPI